MCNSKEKIINVKSVPNQKVIKIPNRQIKNALIFDINTFENALNNLDNGEFKIWCYLYNNKENIDLPLSAIDCQIKLNISRSTYLRNIKTLIEKGYLIQTNRKNYFIFVDNPNKLPIENQMEIKENNKISVGENIIRQLLIKNNINFTREATFGTCLFPNTNYPAKFDFFIEGKYLLEFDGEQHFFASERFWNTIEQVQKTQEHDIYKNQWCKENNIPLIRIPYTKLNTLTIEDLILETTQFRVV